MSNENLDYLADRYCPVFERVINCDWCYESIMGLTRKIKVESVRELDEISDIEAARVLCDECPYSEL